MLEDEAGGGGAKKRIKIHAFHYTDLRRRRFNVPVLGFFGIGAVNKKKFHWKTVNVYVEQCVTGGTTRNGNRFDERTLGFDRDFGSRGTRCQNVVVSCANVKQILKLRLENQGRTRIDGLNEIVAITGRDNKLHVLRMHRLMCTLGF